jgi:hypothetical protein
MSIFAAIFSEIPALDQYRRQAARSENERTQLIGSCNRRGASNVHPDSVEQQLKRKTLATNNVLAHWVNRSTPRLPAIC